MADLPSEDTAPVDTPAGVQAVGGGWMSTLTGMSEMWGAGLRRADVELSAATVSAQIARGLLLDHATHEVLELAAQAVSDEVRHSRICHEVGERYLGRSAPAPRSSWPHRGLPGRSR